MKHFYQSVTTDIVIFTIEDDQLKVLLIKRANEPFKNQWALPGGFLFEKEEPHKAAERVLKEKAGIENVYLEQLYTFGGSGRDPRGKIITISYFVLTPKDKIKIVSSPKIQTPTFRSIKKLPDMAFDHNRIITYALQRLQSKLEYTNVVYSLLPQYFTFNQLQKTYEIILNKKLDKRNFRKKFMLLGLIKPTKKILKGERQRPAKLYRFVSRKPTELKKFF
ncbi:MAG: NUDIX hydrolase [Candidatus Yanofskybacteria bacterium]|nr:NUDIX hydrolase [Candidatus Yanofskybacteria bacterium]